MNYATFVEESTRYVRAKLEWQDIFKAQATVPKRCIYLVLGHGYKPAQVDRRRKKGSKYYDADLPKPIDDKASCLEWLLNELLEYQKKKKRKH